MNAATNMTTLIHELTFNLFQRSCFGFGQTLVDHDEADDADQAIQPECAMCAEAFD